MTSLESRRRYRRVFYGTIALAVLAFAVAQSIDRPLVGVAAYWLLVLAAFVVLYATPLALFDERERALERRASHYTLVASGLALIVLAPGATALDALDARVPDVLDGVLLALALQFVAFAAIYGVLRYRR